MGKADKYRLEHWQDLEVVLGLRPTRGDEGLLQVRELWGHMHEHGKRAAKTSEYRSWLSWLRVALGNRPIYPVQIDELE